jgi:hypothetical protein
VSANPRSMQNLARGPDVLGELLHSISQPLTSLRCSLELSILELSIDEGAERRQEGVAAALQQTETVIGMVQLMREYLDAEHGGPEACPVALAAVLRSLIQELSSIAEVQGVRVRMAGTCAAVLSLPESRLRLALQYLIAPMIDGQPLGGKVTLLLGDGPEGAVLRVEGDRGSESPNLCEYNDPEPGASSTKSQTQGAATNGSTLQRVRMAIARRVLESAGALLTFSDGAGVGIAFIGFVLTIPRSPLWR